MVHVYNPRAIKVPISTMTNIHIQNSHIFMFQFTKDLDFPECSNAGQQRLKHAWDFLQSSSTAIPRVQN